MVHHDSSGVEPLGIGAKHDELMLLSLTHIAGGRKQTRAPCGRNRLTTTVSSAAARALHTLDSLLIGVVVRTCQVYCQHVRLVGSPRTSRALARRG